MTTLGRIGMVRVHDNVNVFGLGGIDLLCCCCCGTASSETCYCQYIHTMLLWACKIYCCCTYNMNNPHSIHNPVADLYRWSWGRVAGGFLKCATATANTSQVFECWAASSLATDTGENQSAVPFDNDVIITSLSLWLRHARTLYTYFFQIFEWMLYLKYIYILK